jgi:hypothetical protein
MARGRKPRPPRPPRKPSLLDPLRDVLGQVLAVLTTALALVLVSIMGITPDAGQCPGGSTWPPVAAVVRDDAGGMPESAASTVAGVHATDGLTRVTLVGRDGIEPPTLRFSAARSTD